MKLDFDLETIYGNLYLKDFKDVKVSGELTRRIKFTENQSQLFHNPIVENNIFDFTLKL